MQKDLTMIHFRYATNVAKFTKIIAVIASVSEAIQGNGGRAGLLPPSPNGYGGQVVAEPVIGRAFARPGGSSQ